MPLFTAAANDCIFFKYIFKAFVPLFLNRTAEVLDKGESKRMTWMKGSQGGIEPVVVTTVLRGHLTKNCFFLSFHL